MKKSTFFAILGMGLLLTSYGCLVYGIYLGQRNEMYVNMFVVFFLLGAVGFFAYLKTLNKEQRESKKLFY